MLPSLFLLAGFPGGSGGAGGSDEKKASDLSLYTLAWAFYLLLGLAGIAWLGMLHGHLGPSLWIDPSAWWIDLALGVVGGLLLFVSWEAMRRIFPAASELESKIREMIGSIRRDEAIGLAVLSGIAEEVFFRGAVQGAWGFPIATVLFSILHTGPGRVFRLWTLFALIAGVILGVLALWRGNLLAPIVAHVLVNAINLSRIADAGRVPES